MLAMCRDVLLSLALLLLCTCDSQPACTSPAPVTWSRNASWDDMAPVNSISSSSSSSLVLFSTNDTERLPCIVACTRMAPCVAMVTERGSGLCALLARHPTKEDVITGAMRPYPGAAFLSSDRPPSYTAANASSTALPRECPTSLGYQHAGAYCLKYQATPLTWEQARVLCQSQGADLATAPTLEKLAVVSQFLISRFTATSSWLGASVVNGTGVWLDGSSMNPALYISEFVASSSSPGSHAALIAFIGQIDFAAGVQETSLCEVL